MVTQPGFWSFQRRSLQRHFGQTWKRWAIGAVLLTGSLGVGPLPARAEATDPWHHLPEYTALTFLLDTSNATWTQLSQFQIFKPLEGSPDVTPQPLGLPLLPVGLDFATQIQPWVGETVVTALLPAEPGAGAAFQDHLVMVAPIVDAGAFAEHQAAILALPGDDPAIQTFENTLIYVWEPVVFDEGDAEEGDPTWNEDDTWEEDGLSNGAEEKALYRDQSGTALGNLSASSPLRRPSLSLVPGARLSLALSPKDHEEDWESWEEDWPDGEGDFELGVPLPTPTFAYRGLALAILPDALVAAETPAAIQQYLTYRREFGVGDRAEETGGDRASLATSREFQRTLANRAETRSLIAVYANALEMLNYELSSEDLAEAGLPLPAPVLTPDLVQNLQAINFGGTLEALLYPTAHGVQFRGRYYYDAVPFTLGLTPTLPEADSPLQLLPASTLVMASGRNLAGFWQGLTQALELSGGEVRDGLDVVRSTFTAATGLDLDRDVMRWMDGEFAIAAFPHAENALLPLGVGLLMQTSDRPAAEAALATFDELMRAWDTPVVARTVNQQPVTSWEMYSLLEDEADFAPYASLLGHGWATDNTLAIVSGIGPMSRIINPTPHDPLADFFLFRQSTAEFPQPNNGYFYLNMGATLSQVYPFLDQFGVGVFVDEFKPALGSLRSLSATTAQTPRHMEIMVQLGLAPRQED